MDQQHKLKQLWVDSENWETITQSQGFVSDRRGSGPPSPDAKGSKDGLMIYQR